MLSGWREIIGDAVLVLRDLDILRPIVFDRGSSIETLLRITRETGVVELLSRSRGAMQDWGLNARGIIGRSPITAKLPPTLTEGTVVVPKPKVYESARALGFDYGPVFQRAQRVTFPHPKRAITTLEPLSEAMAAGSYVTDLTAFDTAFHALFATEEAGVADMPMKRMLPVRFG